MSTAYYALFQEISTHCVERAFPGDAPADVQRRNVAVRWIGHADVRILANAVGDGQRGSQLARVLRPVTADLVQIAAAFGDLQDARHDADYNHEYSVDKRSALSNVDMAYDSVSRAQRLRNEAEVSYQRFLLLMLGATKIARKR